MTLLQVLLEFQSREGRSPDLKTEEADLKLLGELADSVSKTLELPEGKIKEDVLSLLFGETSPTSAVAGGILAQEVIKIISNRERPHSNFFFFNPLETAGVVENIE